jgi:mRNA interferase MazF
MGINWAPEPGTIVRCDFTKFTVPQMTKFRPAVVISPRPQHRSKETCIVVPLSTTKPKFIEDYHLLLSLPEPLPRGLEKECWVKGDIPLAREELGFQL